MRLLLDTHCWIWMLLDSPRLAPGALRLLRSEGSELYLSAASCWEAALKIGRGKLELPHALGEVIAQTVARRVSTLPIEPAHAIQLLDLPAHHRDPFDRILVAQAQVEGLTILTADRALYAYDVPLAWAGDGPAPRPHGGAGKVHEGKPRAVRKRRRPATARGR